MAYYEAPPPSVLGQSDFSRDKRKVSGGGIFHDGVAGMLMLNPAFDYEEQMEILAQKVIPHLRS